jgi:hypothetical protein
VIETMIEDSMEENLLKAIENDICQKKHMKRFSDQSDIFMREQTTSMTFANRNTMDMTYLSSNKLDDDMSD